MKARSLRSIPLELFERRDRFQAATRLVDDCSEPAIGALGEWRDELLASLELLDHVLSTHIADTEAEDGFFNELLEASSGRLRAAIGELRADHGILRGLTRELIAQLEDDPHPEAVRSDVQDLVHRLDEHYARGGDLLWEVYGVDLGSLD